MCLISDYRMPATPGEIDVLFGEYLNHLEQLGLKSFFEPVARCVTLSTHAGVRKPARRIFETAIERLGMAASLTECLFITENAQHIAVCKSYAMQTLQFGPVGTLGWILVIGRRPRCSWHILSLPGTAGTWKWRLTLGSPCVTTCACCPWSLGLQLSASMVGLRTGTRYMGSSSVPGQRLCRVHHPGDDSARRAWPDRGGRAWRAGPEKLTEATHFVATLAANQQIGFSPGPLPPGTTHQAESILRGVVC